MVGRHHFSVILALVGIATIAIGTHACWGQCTSAKILPTGSGSSAGFGWSLAVENDVMVVGTPGQSSGASIVDRAHVLRRVGEDWIQEQVLQPVGVGYSSFGRAVAVRGDIVVVGAPWDADFGTLSGAVHVYRFNGTGWIQEQKVFPADPTSSKRFGGSVAIDGDTLAVGAYGDAQLGSSAGAVYVFEFDGANWQQVQKLVASDGSQSDQLGWRLAMEGETIVASANAAEALDPVAGGDSGAAYVFEKSAGTWAETQKLSPADAQDDDKFGSSVAISDGWMLVGARREDELGNSAGAAYLFQSDGVSWTEDQKLLAFDGQALDQFGRSVALSADFAVVGAISAATSGQLYVYSRVGQIWSFETVLTVPVDGAGDSLGSSAAIEGSFLFAGAIGDDDYANEAGAVYEYSFDAACVTEFQRGDVSADGLVDIGDAIALLGELFGGSGPLACDDSADSNDDGLKNIGDVISILATLFTMGPPPPAPYSTCGPDPTLDMLDCQSYPGCP